MKTKQIRAFSRSIFISCFVFFSERSEWLTICSGSPFSRCYCQNMNTKTHPNTYCTRFSVESRERECNSITAGVHRVHNNKSMRCPAAQPAVFNILKHAALYYTFKCIWTISELHLFHFESLFEPNYFLDCRMIAFLLSFRFSTGFCVFVNVVSGLFLFEKSFLTKV